MRKISLLVLFCFSLIFVSYSQNAVTPQTALDAYVHNTDQTGGWEIRKTYQVDQTHVYSLLFISQKWEGILWKHELLVFVPDTICHDGALLFIDGGSVREGIPNYLKEANDFVYFLSNIANNNKALVCLLKQVPNQPLFGDLKEDALISYTLNEFRKDGDYSWPLLFPMVKSAYRAMDAIQELSRERFNLTVSRFLVSGASKRGWTTWLTGALQDSRVSAIAPMVIDMLNMPVTLDYQKQLYGEYSDEIQDYVNLEIPQAIHSEFGSAVVQMIDPYSYRQKLTQPKLIIMGTNDPYWTVDAVKHYINDIPGQNLLHYVANAGHGLGDRKQAFGALDVFFAIMLADEDYPVCKWNVSEKRKKIELTVTTNPDKLSGACLWTSCSTGRDFRKSKWSKRDLQFDIKDSSVIKVSLKYPKSGFQAFYVDLIYRNPSGDAYSVSTRMFVSDSKKVFLE